LRKYRTTDYYSYCRHTSSGIDRCFPNTKRDTRKRGGKTTKATTTKKDDDAPKVATTASTRDDVGLLVGNNKAFLLKAFWDLEQLDLVGVKAAFWWCVANMVSQE
jgi:hypothetical protein